MEYMSMNIHRGKVLRVHGSAHKESNLKETISSQWHAAQKLQY